MSFTTLDDAWGAPAAPAPQVTQMPQKVFQGGNVPQKVFQGGNAPQKVFENGQGPGYSVGTQGQPQSAREIARLQAMVQRLMHENQAQRTMNNAARSNRGMTIPEICCVVTAMVFIVLVIYLISLIRALK